MPFVSMRTIFWIFIILSIVKSDFDPIDIFDLCQAANEEIVIYGLPINAIDPNKKQTWDKNTAIMDAMIGSKFTEFPGKASIDMACMNFNNEKGEPESLPVIIKTEVISKAYKEIQVIKKMTDIGKGIKFYGCQHSFHKLQPEDPIIQTPNQDFTPKFFMVETKSSGTLYFKVETEHLSLISIEDKINGNPLFISKIKIDSKSAYLDLTDETLSFVQQKFALDFWHSQIENYWRTITFSQKIEIIKDIFSRVVQIFEFGYSQNDLHGYNVMIGFDMKMYLIDFDLMIPVKKSANDIVSTEILRKQLDDLFYIAFTREEFYIFEFFANIERIKKEWFPKTHFSPEMNKKNVSQYSANQYQLNILEEIRGKVPLLLGYLRKIDKWIDSEEMKQGHLQQLQKFIYKLQEYDSVIENKQILSNDSMNEVESIAIEREEYELMDMKKDLLFLNNFDNEFNEVMKSELIQKLGIFEEYRAPELHLEKPMWNDRFAKLVDLMHRANNPSIDFPFTVETVFKILDDLIQPNFLHKAKPIIVFADKDACSLVKELTLENDLAKYQDLQTSNLMTPINFHEAKKIQLLL